MEQQRLSKIEKAQTQTIPIKLYTKLPQTNPKPTQTKLNLTVFNLSVPITITYANIAVQKAEVSKDKKNLNVVVQNIGDKPLSKVDVNLSKPFQADITTLSNLEANATKTLSFALPETNKTIEGNLSISFALPNQNSTKLYLEYYGCY